VDADASPPRVLLGNIEPILGIGLAAVLTDSGADVVGRERMPPRIVAEADRLQPDVVVLNRDDAGSRSLCVQVRRVAPTSKVILWARDESVMEVLDPGSGVARLIRATVPEDLSREVADGRQRHGNRVEE
jgi:AmiR/NasT family two-component response regulator